MDIDTVPRGTKRTADGSPVVTAPRRIKVSLIGLCVSERELIKCGLLMQTL